MVMVPFTKKRNLRGLKGPALSGHKQLTTDVKCLKLISDERLTWKEQLENMMNKAPQRLVDLSGPIE
jgi:hypothetical protein